MDQRFRRSTFAGSRDHDEPQSSSETGGDDSPLSGDDTRATATTATTTALSPKKGRRSIQKRVVTIPFGDVDGSRSGKGEAYPPSDSWAWRKYGQKPIKGSPYPRGYYRCSSSKGCPARKQVERSRVDPTTLIITYASEHNHPAPATKHHHHHNHHQSSAAAPATPISPATPTPPSDDVDTDAATCTEEFPSEERKELLACAAELGLGGAVIMDFSWLSDVVKEAPSFVGPSWDDDDADVSGLSMTSTTTVNMREEDVSLFADLDELPECSAVFRTRRGTSTCTLRPAAAASLCGTTG